MSHLPSSSSASLTQSLISPKLPSKRYHSVEDLSQYTQKQNNTDTDTDGDSHHDDIRVNVENHDADDTSVASSDDGDTARSTASNKTALLSAIFTMVISLPALIGA